MSEKLTSFAIDGEPQETSYVETQQVTDSVECDVYTFVGDDTQDLAIVRVAAGLKTPLQLILMGDRTTEGFLEGQGTLTVTAEDGSDTSYDFPYDDNGGDVITRVGQLMQWEAGEGGLTFYEICEPSYKDGRFQNLPV